MTERAKQLAGTVPDDAFDVAVDMLSPSRRKEYLAARSRRKREVRAATISVRRISKRELAIGRALYPVEEDQGRPATRGDCADAPRPCPFVSCRYNLYIDVSPRTGTVKLNFPDIEPDEMTESCALDVADRGGETLEVVGALMNWTRERCRQVEVVALGRVRDQHNANILDHVGDDHRGRARALPKIP